MDSDTCVALAHALGFEKRRKKKQKEHGPII
jgi:hypothetical protein